MLTSADAGSSPDPGENVVNPGRLGPGVRAFPQTQERTIAGLSDRCDRHPRHDGRDPLVGTTNREAAMSVRATPEGTGSPAAYESYGDEERGYGWVAFAGVLLLILGTINTIE